MLIGLCSDLLCSEYNDKNLAISSKHLLHSGMIEVDGSLVTPLHQQVPHSSGFLQEHLSSLYAVFEFKYSNFDFNIFVFLSGTTKC